VLVAVFADAVCAAISPLNAPTVLDIARTSTSTRACRSRSWPVRCCPRRWCFAGSDCGRRKSSTRDLPQRLGFHIVERWQFSFAQVTKSTRW